MCHGRYKDNPFTTGDSFGSRWDTDSGSTSFSSSWALEKEEPKEPEVTISSIQPIGERFVRLQTYKFILILHNWPGISRKIIGSVELSWMFEKFMVVFFFRLPSRRKLETSMPVAESSEARQKFANAKAISSDMFFGRESNAEVLTAWKQLTHLFTAGK